MKKFTFIASLLLTCAGITASAQTYTFKKFASLGTKITSASEIVDGGTYAFHAVNLNKYIKLTDFANHKLNNDGTLEATDATDGLAVFKIHVKSGETTTYSFETAFPGVYMQPVVDGSCFGGTNEATFEIRTTNVDGAAPSSGTFCIKNSGDNLWFDMQSAQFVGWGGKGDNCGYDIYPVTLSETETVTYHRPVATVKLPDETIEPTNIKFFEDKYYVDGTELTISIPTASSCYTFTQVNASNVVTTGNTEFVFAATKSADAPVAFSTAESKTWYKVQIKNGSRTLKSIAEDNVFHVFSEQKSFNKTDLGDYAGFSSAVWSFVESGIGVKVYNKGVDKYLKWQSGAAELVGESDASVFYFATNSEAGTNLGFSLWTGKGNEYLNASVTYPAGSQNANARLGVWDNAGSKNNSGSCLLLEAIDEDANLVTVGKDCMKNQVPVEVNATYVTAGLQGDIDKAIISANVDGAASVADLDAAFDVFISEMNKPSADIDPNAVYRIVCVNNTLSKRYPATQAIFVGTDGTIDAAYNADNSVNRVIRRTAATGDLLSQLWQFEANADGTYKIKSANVGGYMSNNANESINIPTEGSKWSGNFVIKSYPGQTIDQVTNDCTTMFQILLGEKGLNAWSGDWGDTMQGQNSLTDRNNYWQIEKVTEIPVSIGETGYASVGYPFAVQLPEGDVKAYYASQAENGVMTLAEITDGLIPANTGAILVNESEAGGAANVTLTITTTDKTIGGNKLVAANAKRIGFAEDENYLLAVDDDDKVKFLQATITTVPANKAYLPAANISGTNPANALAFSFGDDQTGINSIVKVGGNVKYYDLKGRRVLNPSNGVFITSDGKKVFIK